MNGFLANTDPDWFDLLASRRDPEVNFWRPSRVAFRALRAGEPLLFRLKSPRNAVGGFGFFQRFTPVVPDWLAWQTFGAANGVRSSRELSDRLDAIRRRNKIEGPATVGCIVLSTPVFLPESLWVPLREEQTAARWRSAGGMAARNAHPPRSHGATRRRHGGGDGATA